MIKVCKVCKTEKPLSEFYYSEKLTTRDKRRPECKKCNSERIISWQKANPEESRERKRLWRRANPEKYREEARRRYKTNPEKIKEIVRKWNKANPEKLSKIHHNWYVKNKEKFKRKHDLWVKANPDKIREMAQRRLNTTKGRINDRMSSSIYQALRENKRNRHWESLVGYTVEDLRKHLEKNFINGISWENFGQWHIDHIIPISVFNFKSSEDIDFKKCWALKNLQPLWAHDNLIKHNHLVEPFQPAFMF